MGFWMVRSRKCSVEAVVGALVFLLTTASAAVGQGVPVSLPANAVINSIGQTTVVNITIGSVTNVEGLALSFVYNEAIADVMTAGNVARGPLTQNCDSAVINVSDPGRLTITAACFSTPVSGSGTLFSVTFTGTGNGSTPLTFSTFVVMGEDLIPNGCLLNEGTPACMPMNGNLTVGVVGPTSTTTATRSLTPTRTATNTVPPINTGTATNTPISTATRTNTVALATATSSATQTASPTVTDTPTTGPSPTQSNTTTPVDTATITQTPSVTNTPVNTGTATDTPEPSATATITSTGTITGTATITRTRPGIPVVPSPASPGGMAMIAGLGVALLWALRRLYQPQ